MVLDKNNETLLQVLCETESTESREGIEVSFEKLNDTMRYLLRVDQRREYFSHVCSALMNFELSEKFIDHLLRANSLREAMRSYKSDILQNISFNLRKRKREDLEFKEMDQELIDRYLHNFWSTPEKKQIRLRKTKIVANVGD